MKLGVLLLNLGGPETMNDVEGFLFNLFADPDIIRLPPVISFLQKPLAWFIAKRRAPQSSLAYESIGGGSPIVKYTGAQADLIQKDLQSRGLNAKCYFAMRYWNPYTEEVLEQMQNDGVNTLVIAPLYPQYSISTSGSSLKLLQDIFYRKADVWGPEKVLHTVVPAWYYRKGYVTAMARLVLTEIGSYSAADMIEGVHVLFSAHGVPQSYIVAGDPYQRHVEECVKLIAAEVSTQLLNVKTRPAGIDEVTAMALSGAFAKADYSNGEVDIDTKEVRFHLSFQSRVGPVQWLKPYTEAKLIELGESGIKNLVVVPVSFVSEHIETLEEIDMEYRELAEENGISNWRRVSALNTDEGFIEDMADMVVDALKSPSLSISEASSQSYEMVMQNDGTGKIPTLSLTAERINGRFAMLGIVATTLAELVNGHPIVSMIK
jgi:ferrochelatase